MHLRVLDDGDGAPAWNMAVDEALLLAGGPPTLRFYGWRPHAVSLGYFQRADAFADLPADVPRVRRLTGGGAIFHGDELTFALAVDAALLPAEVPASYALLHDAVAAALARAGVATQRLTAGHAPGARPQARWCFAEPGQGDLVTPVGKLLGSAQRRIAVPRRRVLHHGSLVLRAPAATPFVAAVADTVEPAGVQAALRADIAAAFASALGFTAAGGTLTAAERALADRLRARYADPAFTNRR